MNLSFHGAVPYRGKVNDLSLANHWDPKDSRRQKKGDSTVLR